MHGSEVCSPAFAPRLIYVTPARKISVIMAIGYSLATKFAFVNVMDTMVLFVASQTIKPRVLSDGARLHPQGLSLVFLHTVHALPPRAS